MTNKYTFLLITFLSWYTLTAKNFPVHEYNHAGPFSVNTPFLVDDANVNGQKFSEKELLNTFLSEKQTQQTGI
ncbi:MAG: hypothetical protein LUD02_13550 [Tannerellaceae bacterium]|nr:hypothetical protein [Tannerellaceae bacterium]MCD8265040.1 hypothetical protein [Tannerellaceae bacterium]